MEDESLLEAGYAAVSNLYMILMTAVGGYGFFRLSKPFFMEKKRAWLIGAVYFAGMRLLYVLPWQISNSTAYGLGILAAFLVMAGVDKGRVEQKLFLSVTFFSVRGLILAMVNCLGQVLYFESMKLPGFGADLHFQFWIFTGNSAAAVLTAYVLMRICTTRIVKAYTYKYAPVSWKEVLMLSMPSFMAVMGYELICYYDRLYEKDTGKTLFDAYGSYTWISFLYYGFVLFTILVVIILFQNLKGRQREERQKELLNKQIDNMKRHIAEVEGLYQRIRSMKHDMAGHAAVLEALMTERENEEAAQYLSSLKQRLDLGVQEIKTGNPVTDVILTGRKREAEEKGIVFQSEFYYPSDMKVDVFDISIILNNALDNAIEAAAECEEGCVRLRTFRRKHMYMMEFCNSYCGTVFRDEERDLLLTTKEHTGGHGIGLQNIRSISQKYHGGIEVEYDGRQFMLSVMLMAD